MGRALVIGAQTGGLSGVHHDAADVAEWLVANSFTVDLRVEDDATRDAIFDGLAALIADVEPGEPAVVYYAGHGGVIDVHDMDQTRLGFLVPTDHDPRGAFRGVLELEWSSRIVELTRRTPDVVVIHDCCHAATTMRDAGGRTRALGEIRIGASDVPFVRDAFADLAVFPLGNPDAVRFSASSASGQAWEQRTASGRVRGVFTRCLLEEAPAPGTPATSWAELARRVRARVLQPSGRQRPEIEGPTHRRVLGGGSQLAPVQVEIRPEGRDVVFAAGMIHGVEAGDVFRSSGPDARIAVARRVGVFESRVDVDRPPGGTYPRTVAAALRATRYPVAVESDEPCGGAAVAAAVSNTPRLYTGDGDNAFARLRLARGELAISDEHGPLCTPIAARGDGVERAVAVLSQLAAARALQRTADQLGATAELAMGVARAAREPEWLDDGAELRASDRICARIENRGDHTLWLHLFAVGPGPVLEPLGPVSSGVEIERRSHVTLGTLPVVGLVGFQLGWPADMVDGRARPVDLIAIATTRPVDMSGVVWPDVRAAPRSAIQSQVHAMQPFDRARHARPLPVADRALAARRRFRMRP